MPDEVAADEGAMDEAARDESAADEKAIDERTDEDCALEEGTSEAAELWLELQACSHCHASHSSALLGVLPGLIQ